jgi:hypothetical protein
MKGTPVLASDLHTCTSQAGQEPLNQQILTAKCKDSSTTATRFRNTTETAALTWESHRHFPMTRSWFQMA